VIQRVEDVILTVPSLIFVVLIGVYAIYVRSTIGTLPGGNIWDVIFPMVTETIVLSVIGLFWWLFFVVNSIGSELGRMEILLRLGSRWRALFRSTAGAARLLLLGGGVLFVLTTLIAWPLGPSVEWSEPTQASAASGTVNSAFSAANLAQFFPSPLVALLACGLFTCAAFVVVAFFCLSVSLRFGRRIGLAVIALIYFWAALSGFGVLNIAPQLDFSRVVSLPWALYNHSLPLAVGALCATVLLSAVIIFSSLAWLREWAARRFAISIVVVLFVVLAAVQASTRSRGVVSGMQVLFAGEFGDIFQYVAMAVVPIAYATSLAARLIDKSGPRFWYEAVRRGSVRRWALGVMGEEARTVPLFSLGVTFVSIVVLGIALGFRIERLDALFFLSLRCFAGVLLETSFLCALVILLFCMTGSVTLWPAIVAAAIVLGYPAIVDLGPINIFAPYSIDVPDVGHMGYAAAPYVACLVGFVIVVVAILVRSSTRNPVQAAGQYR
jgi:hypothetical protein